MEFIDKLEDPYAFILTLAENAPMGVQIFDSKGYSQHVNRWYREIFGAPQAKLNCFSDPRFQGSEFKDPIRRAFAGEKVTLPAFWQTAGVCAIETLSIPVTNKSGSLSNVVFFYRDVTSEMQVREDREKAYKERDDAKLLVRSVLDQTQAVVYIKDLEGRYIFVNGQYCRIFNKTAEEIIGKNDYEMFPLDLAEAFRKNDLQVQDNDVQIEVEETAVHWDGTPHRYLSLKFVIHDSTGSPRGVAGISTDITRLRSLELELNRAKRMESMGLLAGGIAHDFNNILSTVMLAADTLLMTGKSDKDNWRKTMELIKRSAQNAAKLTRQLLTFGSRQTSSPKNVGLPRAIKGIRKILDNALGEDIEFTVDTDESLWPVYIDPTQLEQILTNLCFNARDAMPTGGKLSIRVRNRARVDGNFVELAVTDTGCGIPIELQERIFEPFFTTKKDGNHSGLGLATVYGIVQAAGGSIEVSSQPSKGTTFTISLPMAPGAILTQDSAQIPTPRNLKAKGESILLVEDQTHLRRVTASLLRDWGYRVTDVAGAQSALKEWKRIGKSVDLVITDIIMSGMSGLEMMQKISKANPRSKVKTLFVSAYSEKKLSDYSFKQGKVQFIEKPYSADQLLAKVREVLTT